jgi:hypothetical protein
MFKIFREPIPYKIISTKQYLIIITAIVRRIFSFWHNIRLLEKQAPKSKAKKNDAFLISKQPGENAIGK